jgi:hypothetical protein
MVTDYFSETLVHIYKTTLHPAPKTVRNLDVCNECEIYFSEMERVLRTLCFKHSGTVNDVVVSG